MFKENKTQVNGRVVEHPNRGEMPSRRVAGARRTGCPPRQGVDLGLNLQDLSAQPAWPPPVARAHASNKLTG